MLILDDILLFPARGMLAVFREIHDAAQKELHGEEDSLKADLRELYRSLESGLISPGDFEEQEKSILDRLEAIECSTSEVGQG